MLYSLSLSCFLSTLNPILNVWSFSSNRPVDPSSSIPSVPSYVQYYTQNECNTQQFHMQRESNQSFNQSGHPIGMCSSPCPSLPPRTQSVLQFGSRRSYPGLLLSFALFFFNNVVCLVDISNLTLYIYIFRQVWY